MPIEARDGGVDKTVQAVWARESGTDKEVQEVIVHDSGTDKTVFTAYNTPSLTTFDDFEDNDVSDWSGDTSALSTRSNGADGTSYSAELSDSSVFSPIVTKGSIGDITSYTHIEFWIYFDSTGDDTGFAQFYWENSAGDNIVMVSFDKDSSLNFQVTLIQTDFNSGSDINYSITASEDTWYKVELRNIDTAARTHGLVFDGVEIATGVKFNKDAGGLDNFALRLNWGGSSTVLYDQIKYG